MIVLSGVPIGVTGIHGKTGEHGFIPADEEKAGEKGIVARNSLTLALSPGERELFRVPIRTHTPNKALR